MANKLNWWEYWIGHCWMTGWRSISSTFRIWSDLMTSNYSGYALLKEDNPQTECIEWFWASLNEDDTYSKEFLEYLMQLAEDVRTGKVETVPFTREMFDEIDDLIGGDLVDSLELDKELTEEEDDGDV